MLLSEQDTNASEKKFLQAACFLGKTVEPLVAIKWILPLVALRSDMLSEPKIKSVASKRF